MLIEATSSFNPRSPRGERQEDGTILQTVDLFQSTLPTRGATDQVRHWEIAGQFQSTLPTRGATWNPWARASSSGFQSTLPTRGATRIRPGSTSNIGFQSTLPTRGATPGWPPIQSSIRFNPRSPRGERLHTATICRPAGSNVSIHAPHAGSDWLGEGYCASLSQFQSTLPTRGATLWAAKSVRLVSCFNPRSPRGERPGCP